MCHALKHIKRYGLKHFHHLQIFTYAEMKQYTQGWQQLYYIPPYLAIIVYLYLSQAQYIHSIVIWHLEIYCLLHKATLRNSNTPFTWSANSNTLI